MQYSIIKKDLSQCVILDVIIFVCIYFIPSLSHHLPFPVYLFEPMRIMLFATILFSRYKHNTYLVAFSIPLFSFLMTGHPMLIKSLLMSFELLLNVAIFYWLRNRFKSNFFNIFFSIIISKSVYYVFKYMVLEFGVIKLDFISTPLYSQVLIALFLAIIFSILYKKDYK